MEKENTDSKFVRGFVLTVAWMCSTLPLIYAVYAHEWLWLGLLILSMCGAVVNQSVRKLD